MGLIQLKDDRWRSGDHWLFAGVYRILGVEKGAASAFKYNSELVPGQDDLIGRIIVSYKKRFRQPYPFGDKYGDRLEVAEVLGSPLSSIKPFEGYNKILLKHTELRLIVRNSERSWSGPLSSVAGVYLIMDAETGKAYVGSAYGGGGIWQRWCSYAEDGHGGNTELITLLLKEGHAYAEQNFQYSVLEIADLLATKEQVLEREGHWKDTLMSRKFGYNKN